MDIAYWACAIIGVVSAGVSLGYAIAGVRTRDDAAATPSQYALSRSIALFAVAVIALFTSSEPFVAAVAGAMVVVQAIDAVVGARIPDRLKTLGPAFTSLLGLASLVWMLAS